ncbi:MAG: right-handed parallel beta-helix repeat-containing protein [bacterium]|nr:right-handed parallel beta-helix repeat-containing protein [bacterium]
MEFRSISHTLSAGRPTPLLLALILVALGCGLEVNDLPENSVPRILSDIQMSPGPETLSPLAEFDLRIEAIDDDDDELKFLWSATGISNDGSSLGNAGEWINNVSNDSVVTWRAPGSFNEIASIDIMVQVYDYNLQNAVSIVKPLTVGSVVGNIRVLVQDINGAEANIHLAVVGYDTTDTALSEKLFEDIPWGFQAVIGVDSMSSYYGARAKINETDSDFHGYPEIINNHPNQEDTLHLIVVPKTMLQLPCKLGVGTMVSLQDGINHCSVNGLDSMVVMPGSYNLTQQQITGPTIGTAAIDLSGADLKLFAFPGKGMIELDAGPSDCDFGFYLEGNTSETLVRGFSITGSISSGAYLYNASAVFDSLTFRECGTTGVFLNGDAGNTLEFRNSSCIENDHGISVSGGHLIAERLLIQDSHWYGMWLRDGSSAELTEITLVRNEIEGLFIDSNAGAVDITRCLISLCGRGIFSVADPQPTLNCNLYWANNYGDCLGLDPGLEDIFEDPLLADPDADDWRLLADSPALTAACGLIGAFGQYDEIVVLKGKESR